MDATNKSFRKMQISTSLFSDQNAASIAEIWKAGHQIHGTRFWLQKTQTRPRPRGNTTYKIFTLLGQGAETNQLLETYCVEGCSWVLLWCRVPRQHAVALLSGMDGKLDAALYLFKSLGSRYVVTFGLET